MSVRPRNSPNLQACEIGDANKSTKDTEHHENQANEQKEETLDKQNKLKKYGFYAITAVLILAIVGVAFYLGTLTGSSSGKGASTSGEGKMELKMHWKGDKDVLNKYGSNEGDACFILAQCFKSFAPNNLGSPLNPYKSCHDELKRFLADHDNGFYYDGPRLVGFITAETNEESTYGKMVLYNVCIRKEYRGKGVGKFLVPEFVKKVAEKRVTPNKKVYVGLDVNFESETSNAAFALYAKLGFIRWWQLCGRISDLDFKVLEEQESKAKASTPEYDFPLAKYMLGGKDFISTQVKSYKHLCMIMMLDRDDFNSIGKNIKEAVKEAKKIK